jgi:hypothetical protein
MGLIGELLVLEECLLDVAGTSIALESWGGPLGAAQDFVIGATAIEVKARASGEPPAVRISSEGQLDSAQFQVLYLCVQALERLQSPTDSSFTVAELAARVRQRVVDADVNCVATFDARLAAAGFSHQHDYSHCCFSRGGQTVYRVASGFPCVTRATLPNGVTKVRYELNLGACGDFIVSPSALMAAIRGGVQNGC